MGLFSFRTVWKPVFLSMLFTGLASFALSEDRLGPDGNYQRLSHEFVLSPRNQVAAYCEPGDTLVKGECESSAERRNDFIYLDGTIQSEGGRTGWTCKARFVRGEQDELRITAVAKCKKSPQGKIGGQSGAKALRSKS